MKYTQSIIRKRNSVKWGEGWKPGLEAWISVWRDCGEGGIVGGAEAQKCMVGEAWVSSRLEEGGRSMPQTLQMPGGQQGDRLGEKGR